MDRERWNALNPRSLPSTTSDVFYVRISKTGPRGGKRPPLWEGYVRAPVGDYNAALADAESELLRTCREEVRCG